MLVARSSLLRGVLPLFPTPLWGEAEKRGCRQSSVDRPAARGDQFHEMRVEVAEVQRLPAARPVDTALDRDAVLAEGMFPRRQLGRMDGEGRVEGAGAGVRWERSAGQDGRPGRGAALEEQEDLPVRDAESAESLVAGHALEAEHGFIEARGTVEVLDVEGGFQNPVNNWHDVNLRAPRLLLIGRLLSQQIGEKVIEVRLGHLIDNIGRHWRELRDGALVNARLRHPHLLALVVRQHQDRSLLLQQQPRNHLSLLERQCRCPERLIDVAVGVERVLQQAIEPAQADAVQLWADLRPLAAELMADGAVLLKDLLSLGDVLLRGDEA